MKIRDMFTATMCNSRTSGELCIALIVLLLCCANGQNPVSCKSNSCKRTEEVEKPYKICNKIHIRNSVSQFSKLENCTVIEGSLSILLIEYSNDEEYNQLHYPDLVEVTQYVLLYRVYGLKTLRHIFPNLAVIRGQRLFYNYALVVYEMINMEELGLVNLTYIERGAVRLEKNPNLCYVSTVDWTKIATNVKMSDNFFKGNKAYKECVNMCPPDCPKTKIEGRAFPRCWTSTDCQQILSHCPKDTPCKTFCYHGTCCHEKCVGGCYGPTVEDCIACKNVTDYVDGRRRCMARCPPGTYKFENRRCLLDTECSALKMNLISYQAETPGECARVCPPSYTKDDTSSVSRCVPCKGRCPKVCPAKRVDSITNAQTLRGCTYIKGALEIRIMTGSNIGQELEANLQAIEEVESYIWIHASHSLLSLNFFRNLKKIHGKHLYHGQYALLINDNSNLQKLFPDEIEKNLEIRKGAMFIQFNRKLCYNKIEKFENRVKMNDSENNSISKVNNGDQMPCSVATLNLTILQVGPRVAFLRWENFKVPDPRNLLSYVVHYKTAPKQNVSIYDGRDACSDDLWETKDVLVKKDQNDSHIIELIVNLKPWTQYAVYVETYTTALARKGAMSNLIYFRTAATAPTIPYNLQVRALKRGQLHVTWEEPQHPYGNVTHYELYWRKQDFDPTKYELRDYCNSPLIVDEMEEKAFQKTTDDQRRNQTSDSTCCACPKTREEMDVDRMEREMQIKFQNFLQTVVYMKRDMRVKKDKSSRSRPRREAGTPTMGPSFQVDPAGLNDTTLFYNSSTENDTRVQEPPYFRAVVFKKEFIIPNLGHYEDYNIQVIACQERDPRDKRKGEERLCSSRALAVARTLVSETADNINSSTITVTMLKNKTGDVLINWKAPTSPNGLIITYEIRFSKADISNVQPTVICISHKKFKKLRGYKVPNLDPGNYTFSIRATSLAGNGTWSEAKFFVIPDPTVGGLAQEMIIVVCVIVGVFIVVGTGIIVWCVARRRFSKYPEIKNVSVNPEYMANFETYTPDSWEVERDKVTLIHELGQGSFGMVYEGVVIDLKDGPDDHKVAVKTVNPNASFSERMSFLSEASIMKSFKCTHVVQLLGVVSEGVSSGKQALVIMELMSNGDLKNFLRRHRPDEEDNDGRTPPTLRQIMQMAGEIADGMAYLADKKFVHRDLAARNCMVAEDLTVKIGDFGMTRDIYETDYYRKGGKGLLPVRWMAPESLKDGIFTSMSDVWSYGVVLWEMATLAAQPYQGLSNEEVLKYVINAKTMDKPEGCPDKLYELMYVCWKYKPKQRPTFKEIIELLVPDIDVSFKDRSYFFSDDNRQEVLEYCDDYDEDDHNRDDSHVPFIVDGVSEGATGGHYGSHDLDDEDVDFVDVDIDYKIPSFEHNRSATASEKCDCILLQETKKPCVVAGSSHNDNHNNLNSAIVSSSNEGSRESSKSSNSSYAPMNGLNIPQSIANGHVPLHLRSPTC